MVTDLRRLLEISATEVVRLVRRVLRSSARFCARIGLGVESYNAIQVGTQERKWTSNLLLRKLLRRDSPPRIQQRNQFTVVIAGFGQSFYFSSDCCFTGQSASIARAKLLQLVAAGA